MIDANRKSGWGGEGVALYAVDGQGELIEFIASSYVLICRIRISVNLAKRMVKIF